MPVRIDDQRQVAPGQTPGQFSAPNNQGAAIAARQTSALGQQVTRAASAASDIFVRELEKTNQARVSAALAQAQARAREYEMEGRAVKGANVYAGEFEDTPLPTFYTGQLDRDLSGIEASLGNDAQVAAFRERALPLRENVRLSLEDHTQAQDFVFRVESHTAFAAEGKLSVEQGWSSDTQIGMGLEAIDKGLRDLAGVQGTAPERVDAQIAAAQSGALLGAFTQAATEEDADRVEQLWDAYGDRLLPEDWAKAFALREQFEIRRFSEMASTYVFNPGSVPEGFGQRDAAGPLSFDDAFKLLLPHEGTALVPDDNGAGRARYGITERSHPEAWADGDVTEAEARAIYEEKYWNRLDLGEKPAGVARVLLDIAVNQGVGAAEEMYAQAGDDVEKLTELRKQRYRGTRGYDRYGRTWMSRSDEVLREATNLGGGREPVELPPQRLPESAAEASDFARRYALAGGATASVADRAAQAAGRQYTAQEQARKDAEEKAVQDVYEYARANAVWSVDELPAAMRAAIPVDRLGTVDGHLRNLDPSQLRDTDQPTWLRLQDDAFLARLTEVELAENYLPKLDAGDRRRVLERRAALTGAGPKLPDWQSLPQGWSTTVGQYATDLEMDDEQKAVFMRTAQQAIWDWQYQNGRAMTAVEGAQFVARLAALSGPDGRRLVNTQVGQIPRAQRRLLADDLKQRNGGIEPTEAEIETEYYLRTITGENRRSYELGYR